MKEVWSYSPVIYLHSGARKRDGNTKIVLQAKQQQQQ